MPTSPPSLQPAYLSTLSALPEKPKKIKTKKILIIIVLYHPSQAAVMAFIQSVLHVPGTAVFLSDNSASDKTSQDAWAAVQQAPWFDEARVFYKAHEENIGVGSAQNAGLRFALDQDYPYVMLFDQDSEIENNFIPKLLKAFEKLRRDDASIAAIGPVYYDPRFPPFRRVHFFKGRVGYLKVLAPIEVSFVIASGCLIASTALKEVGLMDEVLFIDHVDVEWCLRCRYKGYRVIQYPLVTMRHELGNIRHVFFKRFMIRSNHPTRCYYRYRNSLILLKKKYLPLRGKIIIFTQLVFYFFRLIFLDHKIKRLGLIFKGIVDGLRYVERDENKENRQ